MTKRRSKTIKEFVEKDFTDYIKRLWVKYAPVLMIGAATVEFKKSEEKYMQMSCRYPYLEHVLYYSQRAFNDWKKGEDLESGILHEFCHILTDPLYVKSTERYVSKQEIEDERERLTDHIALMVYSLTPKSE